MFSVKKEKLLEQLKKISHHFYIKLRIEDYGGHKKPAQCYKCQLKPKRIQHEKAVARKMQPKEKETEETFKVKNTESLTEILQWILKGVAAVKEMFTKFKSAR